MVRLADQRNSDVLYFPKVESLAIGYLAAYLRANSFSAEIIDEEIFGLSREQTVKRLANAGLIGFTAIAKPQIFQIIETIKALREQESTAHFSIGGQYATFLYKELLGLEGVFDSVVRFEGEQTLLELARAIEEGTTLEGIRGLSFKENGKIIENPLRPLIDDLDELPFPARDTMQGVLESGGLPAVSSSRGCYNNCSYCSISSFYRTPGGKHFRLRSPENVLAELQELKRNYPGISEIWFVDDNFVMPGGAGMRRTAELCQGIKELGLQFDIYLRANDVNSKLLQLLKKSGLRNIFIGAESASNHTLQQIFNKNITAEQTLKAIRLCRKMRISVDPGFIMFHPWSTMREIRQNIRFLEAAGQYTLYGIASYLTPYTFTPIGQKMASGEMPYKKPGAVPDQTLNDFVPYEIADERAELLLCLTLEAFEQFRELPVLFSQLRQRARKLKALGLEEEAASMEEKWAEGI
ncbi:MAG: radical SAM protein, partial [Candidatus Diapherotrites archaeon]|nr:radical SAM protein [Candidatus Diapherotrites archaeon]